MTVPLGQPFELLSLESIAANFVYILLKILNRLGDGLSNSKRRTPFQCPNTAAIQKNKRIVPDPRRSISLRRNPVRIDRTSAAFHFPKLSTSLDAQPTGDRNR